MTSKDFAVGDLVRVKNGGSPGALFLQEKPFVYRVVDTRPDHLADIKLTQVGRIERDGSGLEFISLTDLEPLWSYSSDFELVTVESQD